ncbi:HIT-like protein [Hanseniaspora valbyensis NRRL Y-1626]|uniref:HIT-like protein n=1 Tax=Hanseniaspora valbyensis NRRL Y-1626 TaxID=766949 RepID=A0A1B7TIM6_9ASCO|nr:HIT-like protein [Hanseniaspora valbyensis NRRL Y-1626]
MYRDIGSLNWVFNIFDGLKEQDRIRFQNTDFLVSPDMKWTDETDLKSMYMLLLFKDTRLKTIRDLKSSDDLKLLKDVKNDIETKLLKQYGNLPLNKVKLFFHYQPSYYQLHLHIVHCDNELNYKSMLLGKDCHFLDTVIDNLEMNLDYYQKCKMVYCLNDNSELYKRFQK